MASGPPGVRVLGDELNVFRREASSGHSASAYFVGKMVSVLPRIMLVALHFAAIFTLGCAPRVSFSVIYVFCVLLSYNVYGLSAVVSGIATRANAALIAAIIAMALGSLCGYSPTLNDTSILRFFYASWGVEAIYSKEVSAWEELYDIEYSRRKFGFVLHQVQFDFFMMAVIGTMYRVIAFLIITRPHGVLTLPFKAPTTLALEKIEGESGGLLVEDAQP